MAKNYINFNPAQGYPAGKNIFYECSLCNAVIQSMPINAAACECGNIIVDSDAGRVSVKDEGQFRIFKK